ncbi:MAG: deoxyguanosinetriphosphate triphosphohydrolase, partial [Geminicoccaceae bacterium]|nr:deoxyguanosinetriphosphate triphosphohydrolase [Geminicoccaceae bacterium]
GPPGDRGHPVVLAYAAEHDLALDRHPSAEAQVAAVADDIAYSNHDLDDGLRAGLFELDDVLGLPLAGPSFREVLANHPDLERTRLINEGLRRVIDLMVSDLVAESRHRLADQAPASVEDVRSLPEPVIAFSPAVREGIETLRSFLHAHMYGHWRVRRMQRKAQRVVDALFRTFMEAPDCLPPDWRARATAAGEADQASLIGDYIAGMTDRFALDEYDRLVDLSSRHL